MNPNLDSQLTRYLLEDVPKLRTSIESLSTNMTTLNQNFVVFKERTEARLQRMKERISELDGRVENTGENQILDMRAQKEAAEKKLADHEREHKEREEESKKQARIFVMKIVVGITLIIAGAGISHVFTRIVWSPPASASTR